MFSGIRKNDAENESNESLVTTESMEIAEESVTQKKKKKKKKLVTDDEGDGDGGEQVSAGAAVVRKKKKKATNDDDDGTGAETGTIPGTKKKKKKKITVEGEDGSAVTTKKKKKKLRAQDGDEASELRSMDGYLSTDDEISVASLKDKAKAATDASSKGDNTMSIDGEEVGLVSKTKKKKKKSMEDGEEVSVASKPKKKKKSTGDGQEGSVATKKTKKKLRAQDSGVSSSDGNLTTDGEISASHLQDEAKASTDAASKGDNTMSIDGEEGIISKIKKKIKSIEDGEEVSVASKPRKNKKSLADRQEGSVATKKTKKKLRAQDSDVSSSDGNLTTDGEIPASHLQGEAKASTDASSKGDDTMSIDGEEVGVRYKTKKKKKKGVEDGEEVSVTTKKKKKSMEDGEETSVVTKKKKKKMLGAQDGDGTSEARSFYGNLTTDDEISVSSLQDDTKAAAKQTESKDDETGDPAPAPVSQIEFEERVMEFPIGDEAVSSEDVESFEKNEEEIAGADERIEADSSRVEQEDFKKDDSQDSSLDVKTKDEKEVSTEEALESTTKRDATLSEDEDAKAANKDDEAKKDVGSDSIVDDVNMDDTENEAKNKIESIPVEVLVVRSSDGNLTADDEISLSSLKDRAEVAVKETEAPYKDDPTATVADEEVGAESKTKKPNKKSMEDGEEVSASTKKKRRKKKISVDTKDEDEGVEQPRKEDPPDSRSDARMDGNNVNNRADPPSVPTVVIPNENASEVDTKVDSVPIVEPSADATLDLTIRIVSCRKLLKGDRDSSDPYVKIMLGKKELHRTKYLLKTLNPIFTAKHDNLFTGSMKYGELVKAGGIGLEVKDWDRVGTDDLIGLGKVEPKSVLELAKTGKPTTIRLEVPKGRTETEAGFISLCIQDTGIAHDSDEDLPDSENVIDKEAVPQMDSNRPPKGTKKKKLSIEIMSCRGLIAADANGMSDPYVEIRLGSKLLHRTLMVENSLNPAFSVDHNNRYILKCSAKELWANGGIDLVVMDHDLKIAAFGMTDDEIGHVKIPPSTLYESTGQYSEYTLNLPSNPKLAKGRANAGSIAIRVRGMKLKAKDKQASEVEDSTLIDDRAQLDTDEEHSIVEPEDSDSKSGSGGKDADISRRTWASDTKPGDMFESEIKRHDSKVGLNLLDDTPDTSGREEKGQPKVNITWEHLFEKDVAITELEQHVGTLKDENAKLQAEWNKMQYRLKAGKSLATKSSNIDLEEEDAKEEANRKGDAPAYNDATEYPKEEDFGEMDAGLVDLDDTSVSSDEDIDGNNEPPSADSRSPKDRETDSRPSLHIDPGAILSLPVEHDDSLVDVKQDDSDESVVGQLKRSMVGIALDEEWIKNRSRSTLGSYSMGSFNDSATSFASYKSSLSQADNSTHRMFELEQQVQELKDEIDRVLAPFSGAMERGEMHLQLKNVQNNSRKLEEVNGVLQTMNRMQLESLMEMTATYRGYYAGRKRRTCIERTCLGTCLAPIIWCISRMCFRAPVGGSSKEV